MFFQSFWSSKEQRKKKEKKDKVIAVLLCICKRIHLERRLAFYSKQCSCIIGVISGVVYVFVYHVMNPFVRVSSNTFMSSLLTFVKNISELTFKKNFVTNLLVFWNVVETALKQDIAAEHDA